MKKALFFIIFISVFSVFSQTSNYGYTKGTENTYNLVGINGKSFYLERSVSILSCCRDDISLVGINEHGAEYLRLPLWKFANAQDIQLHRTSGGELLALAGTEYSGCDIGGIKYYFARLDTTGTVLTNSILSTVAKYVLATDDGGYFVYSNNQFYKYNSLSQGVSTFTSNLPSVKSIGLLNSGDIMISYVGSVGSRVSVVTSSGSTISDVSVNSVLLKMKQSTSGDIYAIAGNYIQKYSANFSFLKSSQIAFSSTKYINDFQIRGDSVFIVGNDNNNHPFYAILDTSLQMLSISGSNLEYTQPTGLYVDKMDRVNIISTGAAQINPSNTFSGYIRTTLAGNLNTQKDIGVLRVDNVSLTITPNTIYFYNVSASASVTVKNYGSDTVNSFNLCHYAYISGHSPCLVGLNKQFSIKLAPGDSAKLNTGTFYTTRLFVPSDSTLPITYQVCIGTAVPDSEIDSEKSNDFYCYPIKIMEVGIEERGVVQRNLKVYPNPSNKGFTIAAQYKIRSVTVCDVSGREVFETNGYSEELFISEATLTSGMYLFRVLTDQGEITKKVVIE